MSTYFKTRFWHGLTLEEPVTPLCHPFSGFTSIAQQFIKGLALRSSHFKGLDRERNWGKWRGGWGDSLPPLNYFHSPSMPAMQAIIGKHLSDQLAKFVSKNFIVHSVHVSRRRQKAQKDKSPSTNLWFDIYRLCILSCSETRWPGELVSVQCESEFVHLILSIRIVEQHLVSKLQ